MNPEGPTVELPQALSVRLNDFFRMLDEARSGDQQRSRAAGSWLDKNELRLFSNHRLTIGVKTKERWVVLFVAALLQVAVADTNLSPCERASIMGFLRDQLGIDVGESIIAALRIQKDLRSAGINLLKDVLDSLPAGQRAFHKGKLFTLLSEIAGHTDDPLQCEPAMGTPEASELKEILAFFESPPRTRDNPGPTLPQRTPEPTQSEKDGIRHRPAVGPTITPRAALPRTGNPLHLLETCQHLLNDEARAGQGFLDSVVAVPDLAVRRAALGSRKGQAGKVICDAGVCYVPAPTLEGRILFFVADLHGDLDSLHQTLSVTQFHSKDAVMLCFLGDYGDRGPDTMGVLLEVLDLKVHHPERIILLRGNHEHLRPLNAAGKEVTPGSVPERWGQGSADSGYVEGLNDPRIFPLDPGDRWRPHWLLRDLFEGLPVVVLFDDGLVAVHGGVIPRFPSEEPCKGSLDPAVQERLTIAGLFDLRKPQVRQFMTWSRSEYKDEVCFVWLGAQPPNQCFDFGDLASFFKRTGAQRMVRGHDHPGAGFRNEPLGTMLTLCTTRSMNNSLWQCHPHIARYQAGALPTPIELLPSLEPVAR